MDEYLRAILLGAVQALTEFLPISSSGHLVLAPALLGGGSSLTFDVGLHVGTLTATLAYFWRDFLRIALSGLHDGTRHGARIDRWGWEGRLGLWIVLGTVPAVIVGALFDDLIEAHVRQPWMVGVLLIAFGVLLGVADRSTTRLEGLPSMTAGRAMLIGLAQAVALFPGVSRSGVTISAARILHFDRVTATRFSFLLSAPAIAGAATLTLAKAAAGDEAVAVGPMLVGAVTSAALGAVVIHLLLRFVATHSLWPFVWYRIVLGGLVIALALGGQI